MPNSPIRTNFYIDGFNVYYRIAEHDKKSGKNYRWLNYRKLLEKKLKPPEVIGKIYFFTTIGKDADRANRHSALIKALENVNVEVRYGRLLDKKEKQTDVNIAVHMLMDAFNDSFDRCFLLSADSDMVPALHAVQLPPLNKEVVLMTPPHAKFSSHRNIDELSKAANLTLKLKFDDFEGCSFPATINTPQGGVIKMPKGYSTF